MDCVENSSRLKTTTHNMNPVRSLNLLPHTGTVTDSVRAIDVALDWPEATILRLRYRIIGDMHRLRIAQPSSPGRQDGLWDHTCFEVFVKGSAEAYCEFNFSPSRQWAAYRFDAYRQAMAQLNLPSAPPVHVESSPGGFTLEAVVDLNPLTFLDPGSPTKLGLAAVIEECSGSLSYWALRHPPGKADFHHPDGFVLVHNGTGARAAGK
jgi:hypothetical protein